MKEQVYLMKAHNGMMVRVPESRLEAWEQEQEKLAKEGSSAKLTPREEQLKQEILQMLSK